MAEPVTGLPSQVYTRSLACVHCGLCLSACPTYRVTGRETSSPRGRIYLMRGVAEGRIELGELLAEEAYLCLGCRACETACPSGVEFGAMLEETRAAVDEAGLRGGLQPRLERMILRQVVPHRRRLRLLIGLLALAQRTRIDRVASLLLPRSLRALLPEIPARADRRQPPERIPAEGEQRGRVAFLTGCVMPEIFGSVNAATLRVLSRNGFEVVVPRDQTCCGALQAHAGDLDFARGLARRNAAVFEAAGVDAIVVNSAGCGAAMRSAEHWIPGEGASYAGKVRDVCELLDEVGLRPLTHSIQGRLCYDDPCHLIHGQGVSAAPRRLLEQIDGIELVPHADASSCCGAAGTYNLTHREMSQQVLERKMDALAAADPDLIATGNPGCLMQLRAGVRLRGMRARVVHPVELLDQAYQNPHG
ncbi:MAG: (Fe-S)-binding protein [Proteobacteria bacterium]|nr:(Fe-S)-binding protein [Pseudomonadota bacterium]MCZ6782295.1 (Fe-S)-binding protein [Pseudomonadota bacterium]